MLRVYFESDGYSEQVATFQSEDLYISMLPYLLKLAKAQGFDRVTESNEEDWVQAASYYLSGSDVEAQVERIASEEHQDEMIDYVEGVTVWEPLENSFTCAKFLDAVGYKG